MAQINVSTTEEERNKVLLALKEVEGDIVPVAKIATLSGLKPSKTRYVIMDLVDMGLIRKVPHRAFNKHYVRYSYIVL